MLFIMYLPILDTKDRRIVLYIQAGLTVLSMFTAFIFEDNTTLGNIFSIGQFVFSIVFMVVYFVAATDIRARVRSGKYVLQEKLDYNNLTSYEIDSILKARDIDTTISAQHFGHAVRAIKNKLTRDFEKAEKEAFKQENPDLTVFENLGAGALANAVVRGDVENGSVMSGQIAGLISKEETVEEILKDIYYGAAEKIQQEAKRWAGVTRND